MIRYYNQSIIALLHSRSTGLLSGDQFCVYVANRLVTPTLKQSGLSLYSEGELKLDSLIKLYIHDHLDYQYVIVNSSAEAYALELKARKGALFGQKPRLNPIGI